MSDVMKNFDYLNTLDPVALLSRRQQIIAATPNPRDMTDEQLQEMIAIARVLRKRASAPAPKSTSRRAAAPSLDAL